jgi:hypothetical protein
MVKQVQCVMNAYVKAKQNNIFSTHRKITGKIIPVHGTAALFLAYKMKCMT